MTIFPIGHGFGINTDIFETNIINLAAVIGIVISFVGSNLTAVLEDRKKTILNNLQEATQRALEAEQKLNQARTQLELAKKKLKKLELKVFLEQLKKLIQLLVNMKLDFLNYKNLNKKHYRSTNKKLLKKLIYMLFLAS